MSAALGRPKQTQHLSSQSGGNVMSAVLPTA